MAIISRKELEQAECSQFFTHIHRTEHPPLPKSHINPSSTVTRRDDEGCTPMATSVEDPSSTAWISNPWHHLAFHSANEYPPFVYAGMWRCDYQSRMADCPRGFHTIERRAPTYPPAHRVPVPRPFRGAGSPMSRRACSDATLGHERSNRSRRS